eukprot:UN23494
MHSRHGHYEPTRSAPRDYYLDDQLQIPSVERRSSYGHGRSASLLAPARRGHGQSHSHYSPSRMDRRSVDFGMKRYADPTRDEFESFQSSSSIRSQASSINSGYFEPASPVSSRGYVSPGQSTSNSVGYPSAFYGHPRQESMQARKEYHGYREQRSPSQPSGMHSTHLIPDHSPRGSQLRVRNTLPSGLSSNGSSSVGSDNSDGVYLYYSDSYSVT